MKFAPVNLYIQATVCLIILVCSNSLGTAQNVFSVEEYMVHEAGQGIPELEGMTTYRIYVELENEADFVSAIYGGSAEPFSVNVEEPMFNSTFATGGTSGGVIAILTSYFPEVGFDSWFTIGLENAPSAPGQMDVSVLQSEDQPFVENFVAGSPTDGLGFEINDEMGGAWFVLNGTTNGYAGEDLRVLVMQITTASVPWGTLNAQVIPADGSSDSEKIQFGFNGTEVWDLSPPPAVSGCTDPAACNYDESATDDDGSCFYDDCTGCTDIYACNYDSLADADDGSCEYLSCQGCTDLTACNYDENAIYNDGSCDYISCADAGCTIPLACNYDPEAEVNDGSCEFSSCVGCTDESADNYDMSATQDDGSCQFLGCTNPLACNYDFTANVSNDSCDFVTCVGCMDTAACNYSPDFTISSPGFCEFPEEFYDCSDVCLNDLDMDGICDELEIEGCTNPSAENYSADATDDDGTCILPVLGCTNPLACNFDPSANLNDGSCDFVSCTGCTIDSACNYDPEATVSNNGTCNFPNDGEDCEGNCINDIDGDGICNEFEIPGCTNELASNFLELATENDGSCVFPAVCNDPEACNYVPYEGYCIAVEPYAVHEGMVGDSDLTGFTTYRVYALCENESDFVSAVSGDSDFPTSIYSTTNFYHQAAGSVLAETSNPMVFPLIPDLEFDSWVTIGLDGPVSGETGELGVSVLEGDDPWVEPFESGEALTINDDLGGVWYVLNGATNGVAGEDLKVLLGQFTTDGLLGGQMYVQFFEEGDGINGAFSKMIDLQDACIAPQSEGCAFPEPYLGCDGNCLSDMDEDGICDEFEIPGCMDVEANNFDAEATDDDGSCDFTVDPCAPDLTAPSFVFVPADSTVLCSEPMPTGMAIAVDDCDEDVQVIFVDGPIEFVFDCPPFNYLCTRTFYATDDAGNVSEAQQMITVADTLAPEFLNLPADTLFINELDGEEIPEPFMVIQDACDSNADWVAVDELVMSGVASSLLHRTYTASDACGNSSQWQQVLSVILMLPGCTDALACNFDEQANSDDGTCDYPQDFVDCDGTCLNDEDGDGVCDEIEILGCVSSNACNFLEVATEDDGSCDFCSCADEESPVFGLEIDTIQVHVGGALDGLVTYRFYATTENSDDFVSSVYGNDIDTLKLISSTEWYQDTMGSLLPQNISEGVFSTFPDVAFDSWLTIGLDGPLMDDENNVNTVGMPGGGSWTAAFESGEDVILDDAVGGAWFILNGGTNGIAGDDLKVLIAQLTTSGSISGQLNVQIFEQGNNENASTHHFTFEGAEWTNPVSNANACGCTDDAAMNFDNEAEYEDDTCIYPVPGCTDSVACNFDVGADINDGSCVYAEPELDCNGACLEDADADGVCDAFEIFGCTDDLACNYEINATEDDGACEYALFALDCDGNCLNDTDGDGVCDENELNGCTDSGALNYDDAATDDDGSCAYCSLSASAVVFDVSCFGGTDGSASISAEGAYPLDSAVQFQLLPAGEPTVDPVFLNLAAGSYEVVAIDFAGCQDTLEFTIAEPEELQVLLNDVVGSEEGQFQGSIEVDVIGGTGEYDFSWTQLEDVEFSSTDQNLTNLTPGTYVLSVLDANGCNAVSFEIVVESIVGLIENQSKIFMLYPNPAKDWIQIEWNEGTQWSSLLAYDMQGKLVADIPIHSLELGARIDVSNWSSGSYLVLLSDGIEQHNLHVIKSE
jgi:hypothetical protein